MLIFQINNVKTILRRKADETVTEDFLFQKANEMSSFQELLKTQSIKKKYFTNGNGQCAMLTILTEKRKKDKKKKQKNVNSNLNSEAIQ